MVLVIFEAFFVVALLFSTEALPSVLRSSWGCVAALRLVTSGAPSQHLGLFFTIEATMCVDFGMTTREPGSERHRAV